MLFIGCTGDNRKNGLTVTSPNSKISVSISLSNKDQPMYVVTYNNKTIIDGKRVFRK